MTPEARKEIDQAAKRLGVTFGEIAPEELAAAGAAVRIDACDPAVAERVDRREVLAYWHMGRAKTALMRGLWAGALKALVRALAEVSLMCDLAEAAKRQRTSADVADDRR